jgi:peptide/nickel transport system permease protein
VLTIREESYVEAARCIGITTPTIVREEILPNIMPYVMISFVGAARYVIFASVGLYFLGILPFTTLNWGVMMNIAYRGTGALYTLNGAHTILFPMAAIVILSYGLILLSQGMDRLFNPRVRARKRD